MNKIEFEQLQQEAAASGRTLKSFLAERKIPYSSYSYWRRKYTDVVRSVEIAPIVVSQSSELDNVLKFDDGCLPNVTLLMPNGVRAFFGQGSEGVLMEVLRQSM